MKKFNNLIFTTRAVKEELPEEVLLFIINLLRNLHKEIPEVDYLQVLKIRNNILILKQEVPEFRKAYLLPTSVSRCKLFFIDSLHYSTLMFNYEY